MMPSKEELGIVHETILTDFISSAEGLTGMILIGVRDNGDGSTNIEVRSGARVKDVYRACSGMLEALLEADQSGDTRIEDRDEAKAVAAVADILMVMAGDEPENLKKVSMETLWPHNDKNNTKKN